MDMDILHASLLAKSPVSKVENPYHGVLRWKTAHGPVFEIFCSVVDFSEFSEVELQITSKFFPFVFAQISKWPRFIRFGAQFGIRKSRPLWINGTESAPSKRREEKTGLFRTQIGHSEFTKYAACIECMSICNAWWMVFQDFRIMFFF